MSKTEWDVTLDDQRHLVELDHGESLGKVKVRVDGEQVVEDRTSSSADFRFEVAGRSAMIRIKQELGGLQHDYRLIVDGAEIP
ncbi:MAG: hypothetical protein H0X56_09140 [Solirubrobacterales bacterium]|jgi:hypothetical protein|nr:hypothetical protein [Solirubrobacterales bacterium]